MSRGSKLAHVCLAVSVCILTGLGCSSSSTGTGSGNDGKPDASCDVSDDNLPHPNLEPTFITSNHADKAFAVDFDPETGDVFVAGGTSGQMNGEGTEDEFDWRPFVARYSADGMQKWVRVYTDFKEVVYDIEVSAESDAIHIVGGEIGTDSPFIAQLDIATGDQQWSAEPTSYERIITVALNPTTDEILIGGEINSDLGNHTYAGGLGDAAFSAYNSSGAPQWHAAVGTEDLEYLVHLKTRSDGTIVALGRSAGRLNEDPINEEGQFIGAFDSSGNQMWLERRGIRDLFPCNNPDNGQCLGLEVDPMSGDVYSINRTDSEDGYALVHRSSQGAVQSSNVFAQGGLLNVRAFNLSAHHQSGTFHVVGRHDDDGWYGRLDDSGQLVEEFRTREGTGGRGVFHAVDVDQATGDVYLVGGYRGFLEAPFAQREADPAGDALLVRLTGRITDAQ